MNSHEKIMAAIGAFLHAYISFYEIKGYFGFAYLRLETGYDYEKNCKTYKYIEFNYDSKTGEVTSFETDESCWK